MARSNRFKQFVADHSNSMRPKGKQGLSLPQKRADLSRPLSSDRWRPFISSSWVHITSRLHPATHDHNGYSCEQDTAQRLPAFLREHDKQAKLCAAEGVDHVRYLARLAELELIDRERRMVRRRIKAAKFSAIKSLDSFNFVAIPSLNKMVVLELARCDWINTKGHYCPAKPTQPWHWGWRLVRGACRSAL